MRRSLLPISLLTVVALGLAGCGSYGNSSGGVSVTISPTTSNVPVGLTVQFTGVVNGSTNNNVLWQVNKVTGGNFATGTISTTGLYTAPATIPSPATVTVTAQSVAFMTATGDASVTIVAAQVVTVTPAGTTVAAGATQQFTALVNGQPGLPITWQVNNVVGGDAAHGTISTSGLYTAPLSPPPTGQVTITAVAQNVVGSGSATAAIVYANASLNGSYAFSLTGTDAPPTPGLFAIAGSFQADGAGHITGGLMDWNDPTGVFVSVPFSGTYIVGADGRGTANVTANVNGTAVPFVLGLAVVSNQRAIVTEFDSFGTGSGTIDKQTTSAFSTAAISGSYVFNVSGINSSGSPLAAGGVMSASGGVLSGVIDINDNGSGVQHASQVLTGVYSVSANGRGTATLQAPGYFLNYALYVVNTGDLKFVEIDPGTAPVTNGEVVSLATGTLSLGTLNGSHVFTTAGASTNGAFAEGGVLKADGNGNFTSGAGDVNDNGSITSNVVFGGSYTLASSGRGTAMLTGGPKTYNFAIYPAANGTVQMVELDTGAVTSGAALAQSSSTTFSNAAFSGAYGISYSSSVNSGAGEQDASGQLKSDANGILSGQLDLNNVNSTGVRVLQSGALSGSVTAIGSNGRATITLQTPGGPLSLAAYLADGSRAVFIGLNSSSVLAGALRRQF
jgi:hypothetical protein